MTWLRFATSDRAEPAAVDSSPLPTILRGRRGPLVLLVLSLAAVFGSALVAHMRLSTDPLAFNDDARQQIYPFLSTYQPGLFPNDYPARYFLACFPLVFRGLYTALALVADPMAVSKVVPYLLLGVLLVAIGMAAHWLSGMVGAWFALAFVLSSPYFLARLAGGLPRGFGLALMGCVLTALVLGRLRWLAVVTVISAGFYAPAAVLSGLALGAVALVLPPSTRGDLARWTLRQRLVLVIATALGCVAMLLPTFLGSVAYGRTLGPADVVAYPELGPAGRYGAEDRAPFDALPVAVLKMLPEAFRGKEASWNAGLYNWVAAPTTIAAMQPLQWTMLGLCVAIGLGLLLAAWRDASARRLLVLLVVAALAYLVATPIAPAFYLPQRYTAYTIPLIAVVGLPAACRAFARLIHRNRVLLEPALIVLVCGAVLLGTGGTGNREAGMMRVADGDRPIYGWAQTTTPDTVFAIWPSELANNLPYISHRSVLVNYEIHQAFHQGYADEMRARMDALTDAYLATDTAPLIALRDRWGVRYLVVDEQHFTTGIWTYFQPFRTRIEQRLAVLDESGAKPITARLAADRAVFHDGTLAVIDLSTLDASTKAADD